MTSHSNKSPSHGPVTRPAGPVFIVAEKGQAETGALEVYLHLEAVEDILGSVPPGARYEIGGLLAGEAGEDEQGVFVLLRRALPARQARGERTSLTFTPEAWEELWAAQERECPHCRIVGWYHTHPGLGVFLSQQDLFIHRHFFDEAFHIALVLDPADFTWGIFYWEDKRLRSAPGLNLYSEAAHSYPQLVQALREVAPPWIIGPESDE